MSLLTLLSDNGARASIIDHEPCELLRFVTSEVDSVKFDTVRPSNEFWLLAGLALDVEAPSVGPEENVIGFSYKVGVVWNNTIAYYATHTLKGSFDKGQPSKENRFDHTILAGISDRPKFGFL